MTEPRITGLDQAEIKDITRFLVALGDPMRLQLLYLLGDQGRRNVGEITSNFRLSRPAISHQASPEPPGSCRHSMIAIRGSAARDRSKRGVRRSGG